MLYEASQLQKGITLRRLPRTKILLFEHLFRHDLGKKQFEILLRAGIAGRGHWLSSVSFLGRLLKRFETISCVKTLLLWFSIACTLLERVKISFLQFFICPGYPFNLPFGKSIKFSDLIPGCCIEISSEKDMQSKLTKIFTAQIRSNVLAVILPRCYIGR